MNCITCKKPTQISAAGNYRKKCFDCRKVCTARGPIKTTCFSCKKSFILKVKQSTYNFCTPCFKKFLVRGTGTRIEGMDYTREIVRIRDNHICQIKDGGCGRKWRFGKRRFDIHHIGGLCGRFSRAYDNRKYLDGLTTLCHRCHLNLPEVREKMKTKSSPRPLRDREYQEKWLKTNKPWLNR